MEGLAPPPATTRRGAVFLHGSDKKEALRDASRGNLRPQFDSDVAPKRSSSTQPPGSRPMRPNARRPSTQPDPLRQGPGPRRGNRQNSIAVTQFSVPPYTPGQPGGRRHSHRPPATRRDSASSETSLTQQQVLAFREVFDLFDSNGGGTIDAEELQEVLASVDIHITQEEIIDVMKTIDKDGSGEIDFREFLMLMTNTEKFLEIFAAKHDSGDTPERDEGRETVLFDALTQFMKTSALKQMDEIVGYYNTKYKKAQAPHVVMHYAAGARLIGLTEKQLTEHLKKLQASNSGNQKSPYAQPLYNVFFTPRKACKKKQKVAPVLAATKDGPFQPPKGTGKIRLKIHIPSLSESENNTTMEVHNNQKRLGRRNRASVDASAGQTKDFKPKVAWSTPRVKSMNKKLPATNKDLTTEDLPYIREKIDRATREYFRETAERKRKENIEYWRSIGPQHIPSKTLRRNFHRCFRAYIAAGQRKT